MCTKVNQNITYKWAECGDQKITIFHTRVTKKFNQDV